MTALAAFSLVTALWLGLVAALTALPRWRRHRYRLLPLGLVTQGGALALWGAVLHPFPYGWPKLLAVAALATGVTFAAGRWALARGLRPDRGVFSGGALAGCLALALVAAADCLVIFGAQGWEFEKGRWIHGGETYFRPPMNNDLFRHTVVVSALVRRAESTPFLPGSRFTYQLFWHHLTAPFAGVFEGPTLYPVVGGSTTAVAFVLFFWLAWIVHTRRPRLARHPVWALSLVVLLFGHGDLFHMARSWIFEGRLGIEADWSAAPGLFRSFSAKLVGLTAPQHALFFVFFLAFATRGPLLAGLSPPARRRGEGAMVGLAFVCSPLMCAFTFPLWYAGEWIRRRPRRADLAVPALALAAGIALHVVAFRFPPWDLFLRSAGGAVRFLVRDPDSWALAPLLLPAAVGPLGVLALVLLFTRPLRGASLPAALVLFAGTFLFTYLVTESELRRHAAMAAAALAGLFILRALPQGRAPLWRAAALGAAVVTAGLHAYFVHCYVGKPSHLDPSLPWRDYAAMNGIIRSRFPDLAVAAAVQPRGIGLEKPLVMEATTSLSLAHHTAAHVKVTPDQLSWLRRMARTGDTLPYVEPLGYEAVLWGPVEERVWGERARRRFVDESEKLAEAGSVALYRLRDRLKDSVEHREREKDRERWADRLAAEGWGEEALEEYAVLVEAKPHREAEVVLKAGTLYYRLGQPARAAAAADRTLALSPGHAEAYFLKGLALSRLNHFPAAKEAYRRALAVQPDHLQARNNLAVLLNLSGDYFGAEEELRPVVQRAAAEPTILLNFARALMGQHRYREALPHFQRGLDVASHPGLRLQAHLGLGAVYAALNRRKLATRHYEAALTLDPQSAPARAFLSTVEAEGTPAGAALPPGP